MKYLKVEGAGRLRLSGGIIGLGSTSRRQGEEGIFDPIYAIPISDPTSEAEAMSQQTYFFVSDFNFCYHLSLGWVLVFFFFFGRIRGPWVCYLLLGLPYVGFFFRLVLLSHLLFRIDVGLWAMGLLCYIIIIIIIFQILA